MALEWLAPVSGAVLGIAGIVGGVLTARGGRKHDEEMARRRYEYERRQSHESWSREHRADAYVAMLDLASALEVWLDMEEDPRLSIPDAMPSVETQRRCFAQVDAYGSSAVKDALERWRKVSLLAMEARRRVDSGDENARSELHELRATQGSLYGALTAAVAAELGIV